MQPGLYGALQNCQFAISGFAISNRAVESDVSSSDTPGRFYIVLTPGLADLG
jgi:hypothetical protein